MFGGPSLSLLVMVLGLVGCDSAPLDNCQIHCQSSIPSTHPSYRIINPCVYGCHWRQIDVLTSLSADIGKCRQSCVEAYYTRDEQMACGVGCNSSLPANSEMLSSISLINFIYDTFASSLSNIWSSGDVMSVTTVTISGNQISQQDTLIYIISPNKESSSKNNVAKHDTHYQAKSGWLDSYYNNCWKSSFPWLVLHFITALLLFLSLGCCCCWCAGEAHRNYGNRSREITNCEEEPYMECKKIPQPLALPISSYTVPINVTRKLPVY